ncbi:MAG TPA: hypothetical protein VLJ42_09880 [Solirubrobacteraceae bacterium]|nr:hypothetical protein [Solirubrobacteraceae bacterium]
MIAYERGEARVREILAIAYGRGLVPTIPAIALAEVWRGDARDARVARLIKACVVEPVNESLAHMAGSLGRSVSGAETIDACIAAGVLERHDAVPPQTLLTCGRSWGLGSRY